jgi:hypothetical protein
MHSFVDGKCGMRAPQGRAQVQALASARLVLVRAPALALRPRSAKINKLANPLCVYIYIEIYGLYLYCDFELISIEID